MLANMDADPYLNQMYRSTDQDEWYACDVVYHSSHLSYMYSNTNDHQPNNGYLSTASLSRQQTSRSALSIHTQLMSWLYNHARHYSKVPHYQQ